MIVVNYKFMSKLTNKKANGYIALMATIIIGAVLLVMTVEMSQTGWSTRFLILGTEAKAESLALAHSCADLAVAKIMTNPTYLGNSTTTLVSGYCYIFPLLIDTPSPNLLTVKVRGVVRQAVTNLEQQYDMADIYLDEVALPANPPTGTNNLTATPINWQEYPTLP